MDDEADREAWAELMARLGYERYGAHGGDWGSPITMYLAAADPDHVTGIHLTMPVVPPVLFGQLGELTESEQAGLARFAKYQRTGSGYSKQQSTRPQTLGYGLVDSPSGQCAWIVEKFWAWTDCDGHPENVLSKDELLDNVMLYWLPATGASSARLYWESFRDPDLPGSRFRPAARCSRRRSSGSRAARPSCISTTCAAGASSTRAGTSPRSSSPARWSTSSRTFFRDLR